MNHWWLEKPMRMIQTNLREIDADLDVDQYIQRLVEFSADVVLFNVGGIVANYPTNLEWQFRNPYLKDDLVGKVIERVHKAGIRFLARFDFSKINEIYAKQHPEWLYKSVRGETVTYNGQVHTCICAGYQQEYALRILDEACKRYPIDGVFFNMIGFVTYDYDHTYHGICQCKNCASLFAERYGMSLPMRENSSDPAFLKYEQFKRDISQELFHRIHDLVKGIRPEACICTYTHEGVDVFRSESNSGIERNQPEWVYSAGENVRTVLNSWQDMAVVNAAVHFVDFQFRHAAVSPHLTHRRLAQNLASGGWLDYYVIGHLDNQDDRACFEGVKEIYSFHKKNETHFTHLRTISDAALIYPSVNAPFGSLQEFRGIYQMLTEEHILFDVLHDSILETTTLERLIPYQLIILPDMRLLSEKVCEMMDLYVLAGGKLLTTGFCASLDAWGNPLTTPGMRSSGITFFRDRIPFKKGMYWRIKPEDKQTLTGLENLDIIYLNDEFQTFQSSSDTRKFLGHIPAHMFGPPEKCYYLEDAESLAIPGILFNSHGNGCAVTVPWRIGFHYQQFSTHAHPAVFRAILHDLLKLERKLTTNAPHLVEMVLHRQSTTGNLVLNMVNNSGQSWRATHKPLVLRDIDISIHTQEPFSKAISLVSGDSLGLQRSNASGFSFTLPSLALFDSIVLESD